MGEIAICSDVLSERAKYLQNREWPANYMGDFSLMGFVVDSYQDALLVIAAEGYRVMEVQGGANIQIDSPAQLREIQQKLSDNAIRAVLTDVVDSLYQA